MPNPFVSMNIGRLGPKYLLATLQSLKKCFEGLIIFRGICNTTLLEQGLLVARKESEN